MKKIYSLFLMVVALACAWTGQAQSYHFFRDPAFDPEKIYLFDVDIEVKKNAQILVTENITVNVKHQNIRRGIYRDLPVSFTEKASPVALLLDGEEHPFFTEDNSNFLRVNFGNDDYIPTGKHTYTFVYGYTGAIDFRKNYDELYWNVTGNEWNFEIDKARVQVRFPPEVNVQTDGISLYTGLRDEKKHQARQTALLSFETTAQLRPQEGFTIAIPFDKGAIEQPPLWQRIKNILSLPLIFSLIVFIFLVNYFISSWWKVGKDPSYMSITQYDPPKDISPAFMYYLQHGNIDSKLLATAIVDLAMQGYIEVKQTKSFLSTTTELIRTNKPAAPDMPYEETKVLDILFAASSRLTLNQTASSKLNKLDSEIARNFRQREKLYRVSNSSYIQKALILTLVLGIIPFALLKRWEMIFINFHFSVFFLAFTMPVHKMRAKFIVGTFFTLLYSLFWIACLFSSTRPDAWLCQAMFLLSMWGLTLYSTLISNVTAEGKAVFEGISGFKKYMNTAEIYRVAASNPVEAERIFCANLAFAFALGLYNKWIKNFSNILSAAAIERCTASVGGTRYISNGLINTIAASSVSRSSGGRSSFGGSSRGSGSFGGGSSGGGHGGGGGGGR